MTYYRYTDPVIFGDYENSGLCLEQYEVIKQTSCGVWIKYPRNDKYLYNPIKFIEGKKFILEKYWYKKTTNKRFAWPTKELALISYKARKEKQIRLLEGQLEYVKRYLEIANNIKVE